MRWPSPPLFAFIVLCLLSECDSTLSFFSQGPQQQVAIPIYADLLWRQKVTYKNMSIVTALIDRAVFDYCDLAVYTRKGIAPLLSLHHVAEGSPFILYFAGKELTPLCPSSSMEESYPKYWFSILSYYIQRTGASGYLYVSETQDMVKRQNMPWVNLVRGTVYNTRIDIFGAYIIGSDNQAAVEAGLAEAKSLNRTLVADIQDDPNMLDVTLDGNYSVFKTMHFVLLTLSILSVTRTSVYLADYIRVSKRIPLTFCTVSLSLSILADIVRCISALDVTGYRGIFSSDWVRVAYTMPITLGIASGISYLFFWSETASVTIESLQLRIVKISTKSKVLVVSLSLVLVAVDMIVSFFGFYGKAGSTIVVAPALMFIAFMVLLAVATMMVSLKLSKAVTKIQESREMKCAPTGVMNADPGPSLPRDSTTLIDAKKSPDKQLGLAPTANRAFTQTVKFIRPTLVNQVSNKSLVEVLLRTGVKYSIVCALLRLLTIGFFGLMLFNIVYLHSEAFVLWFAPPLVTMLISNLEVKVLGIALNTVNLKKQILNERQRTSKASQEPRASGKRRNMSLTKGK